MQETCFVVMAIGDQSYNGVAVTPADLRSVYSRVIREALIQARSGLEVTRADEVPAPGTITTDVLTRLMHSTYAVVDITYPNPNVFYELGIRHACKPGTLLIRDAQSPVKAPFDVSHQRYFEYEKTPGGIKALAGRFRDAFAWYDAHPGDADNQLLSLAKLVNYSFPQYGREVREEAIDNFADLFTLMLGNPDFFAVIADKSIPETDKQKRAFEALASNPLL